MTDEDLLIECDGLLSVLLYQEKEALTPATKAVLQRLVPELRLTVNRIASRRRNANVSSDGD